MLGKVELFNASSITDTSLDYFEITEQTTVIGFNLAPTEYVTFEMTDIPEAPQPDKNCDPCNMPAVVMPTAFAHQVLTCANGTPVKLSAARPVLVLNAPLACRIRAVFHGHDFSTGDMPVRVYAYGSKAVTIQPANSGCAECCEEATPCVDTAATTDVTITCLNNEVQYIHRTVVTTNSCTNAATTVESWRLQDDTTAPWLSTAPCSNFV
jgi:hypothetical protein